MANESRCSAANAVAAQFCSSGVAADHRDRTCVAVQGPPQACGNRPRHARSVAKRLLHQFGGGGGGRHEG